MEGIVERRCDHCIYAVPILEGNRKVHNASCHRFPPQAIGFPGAGVLNLWPGVMDHDWCGEFKDKWQVRNQKVDP